MEENMQSTSSAFNRAAEGGTEATTGFSFFWMMVFAIAIIDDGDRRTKKRKDKRDKAHKPRPAPRPR
jgi:hypothetical protein